MKISKNFFVVQIRGFCCANPLFIAVGVCFFNKTKFYISSKKQRKNFEISSIIDCAIAWLKWKDCHFRPTLSVIFGVKILSNFIFLLEHMLKFGVPSGGMIKISKFWVWNFNPHNFFLFLVFQKTFFGSILCPKMRRMAISKFWKIQKIKFWGDFFFFFWFPVFVFHQIEKVNMHRR